MEKGNVITNNIEPLYLYYVEKGIFKLSVDHIEGESKTICFHGEGSICPYSLSRPLDGKFQIDVDFFVITAITDIETIRFRPEDFYQALRENPDLSIAMLDYVIMHSNLFMRESLTLSYDSAFVKTCNIVYIYTHYLNKMGINLTQSEIGEMIGETRLEVARSLKKLREGNVIKTSRNCIEVLDSEQLKLYCNPDFVD
ncbi:Crp/Fnr family transcriptional regulator [Oceanobacillus polygoni]|uniref:CRP-like cAMP-binding protein n=1 Tax=Oceanobacillus polygoni TaxID=1235259 RepID=A0A9X1CBE0_9BACI|nr:Crp/Fnr family transcriptional regulator [Oceanobacillus polygoni]MBP2076856.1 CRP-like cAMP-binding protein [Oceanobacillus polygoni]